MIDTSTAPGPSLPPAGLNPGEPEDRGARARVVNPAPDHFIPLGTVQLSFERSRANGLVRLLGHKPSKFVLTEIPAFGGRHLNFESGEPCVVRSVIDERVVGFIARVLRIQFSPDALLFLSYPSVVQELTLRRHERFPVDCEAELSVAGGPGRLVRLQDLSLGGCGLFVPGEELALQAGTPMQIRAQLPGSSEPLVVAGRLRHWRVASDGSGSNLGIEAADEASARTLGLTLERCLRGGAQASSG